MSRVSTRPPLPIPASVFPEADVAALESLGQVADLLRAELARAVTGQRPLIDDLLTALFAGGHCLLVGVPGLAKTLLVRSVARVLDLEFKRVQFTPDLLPADITGTEVIEQNRTTGERVFRFVKGPLFSNLLLADEINRTSPRTQAALLQAMQERQVTCAGQTYDLPRPFFVLATQNPIEQEGTYPLPEAQLDRFMVMLKVDYPAARDELAIIRHPPALHDGSVNGNGSLPLRKVLAGEAILRIQQLVRQLPLSDHVALYCLKLGRSTRPTADAVPEGVRDLLDWGVGPRAIQHLALAARARAALLGQYNVTTHHVRQVAPLILRHRLIPSYHAEVQGIDAEQIVQRLLEEVSEPTPEEYDQLMRE